MHLKLFSKKQVHLIKTLIRFKLISFSEKISVFRKLRWSKKTFFNTEDKDVLILYFSNFSSFHKTCQSHDFQFPSGRTAKKSSYQSSTRKEENSLSKMCVTKSDKAFDRQTGSSFSHVICEREREKEKQYLGKKRKT